MGKLWKVVILIAVIGVMALDIFFDYKAQAHIQPGNSGVDAFANTNIGTSVGDLAPDFTAETLEGTTIQLSELRGKIVVLNLFASWCGPCRAEMPHLVEVSQEVDPLESAFIGLNFQESPGAVKDFQEEFSIQFPLVLDEDGNLTNNLYHPIGLPTSWFIDQDGIVRYVFSGPMSKQTLLKILSDIQSGQEPDPFGI